MKIIEWFNKREKDKQCEELQKFKEAKEKEYKDWLSSDEYRIFLKEKNSNLSDVTIIKEIQESFKYSKGTLFRDPRSVTFIIYALTKEIERINNKLDVITGDK